MTAPPAGKVCSQGSHVARRWTTLGFNFRLRYVSYHGNTSSVSRVHWRCRRWPCSQSCRELRSQYWPVTRTKCRRLLHPAQISGTVVCSVFG